MKLAYSFTNLTGMKDLFKEAMISGKLQAEAGMSPDEAFSKMLGPLLESATNNMFRVELNGNEETVKKLMAKIVDFLGEEGWGLPT